MIKVPYIPPEVVAEARKMDLLTYLQNFAPDELVKVSANTYRTRTHDSLNISNGKWFWFSQGFGGYNALDYLVKVKGFSFREAVEQIAGYAAVCPITYIEPAKPPPPKRLVLPEKSSSTDKITKYLFDRGIDYEIIMDCITKGLIYESLPHCNIVFIGKDEHDKPKYATSRATNNSRFMADAPGSDKRYSFRINGTDEREVHIFESAIDALSYATLCKLECQDWRALNLVSLGGVTVTKSNPTESKLPMVLEDYLQKNYKTERICLHLDNDMPGRKAAEALKTKLISNYEVVDEPPLCGKDFNDFLCFKLGIKQPQNKKKERNFER